MRNNWSSLLGVAVVMALGGGAMLGFGITTSQKRAVLERKRSQRCVQTKKSGHWRGCCILCGGKATETKPVAVGSKPSIYTIPVHICREHLRIGAERARDLALEQRSPSYWALVAGGGGLLVGLVLGTILLLARRRWKQDGLV